MDANPPIPPNPGAEAAAQLPAQVQPEHHSYAPPRQFIQAPLALPQIYPNFQTLPPSVIPFSRPWHIAKLVLGSLSIVTSTVLIAVGIALVAIYGSYSEAYVDIIMVAVVGGIAIIWQVAENITICARPVHRGIHPGAHVGLHLLIFIGAALTMSFIAVFLADDVLSLQSYAGDCSDSEFGCGDSDYYYGSYFGDLSYSDIQTYVAMEASIVAFAAVLMLIHLVLFIRACIETHQRNSIAKTVILIPSGAPIPAANGNVYYMPAPPEMAHLSYLQPQRQMQQQAVPSMTAARGSYALANSIPLSTNNPAVPDPKGMYGYYAAAAAPSPALSPAPAAPMSDRSRAQSSLVSPSPVSEAREMDADKGKRPQALPEDGEAFGSGVGVNEASPR